MPISDENHSRAEHRKFRESFRKGICFACEKPLTSFDSSQPCVHWYLGPVGFTKRHIPILADRFGLFQTQIFMRWVANEDAMGQNINDLKDEGLGRLVELTIRYGDYEWSLSCSKSDFQGHKNASPEAEKPHYHMQIRFKRRSFVKFNDFHLPLHDGDVEIIRMRSENPNLSVRIAGGSSIGDLFDNSPVEELIKAASPSVNADEAALSLTTLVIAEDGSAINGDDIDHLLERARTEGVSFASLVSDLKGAVSSTIVSPGPGVVEQTPRGGRNKGL